MRIAVTMRAVTETATGERRDCVSGDVVALVERWNALPVLVSNALRDPVACVRDMQVDGLLLTGGNDVCGLGGTADAGRDATERALLEFAIQSAMPVFGICRGLQFIARHFGAAMIERVTPRGAHVNVRHGVEIQRDSLEAMTGMRCDARAVETNSFHDCGVRAAALPGALCALGLATDGIVEALRHRTLPIVAVQWHPERAGSAAAIDALLLRTWLNWCSASAARV